MAMATATVKAATSEFDKSVTTGKMLRKLLVRGQDKSANDQYGNKGEEAKHQQPKPMWRLGG